MSKGLEALKELKWQVGNITYFNKNADGLPIRSTTLVRDSGLFEIIEKELKEYEGAKNHIEALHKERIENSLKLKRLEELEKAFVALSKDDEKAKKELSKEIEKNKELNEILEFIKSNIAYTRALCDKTKNSDNDLICFDIRGLVNEETWRKIYKAIGTPII